MLSELSQSLQITIVGGSIPERSGDRLYNTCCVFGTDGKLMEKHRKIHLFDIDIPGQMTFKESLTLTAGESPTIVDTDVGRIGIGICYDIRFQELAMVYAARGPNLTATVSRPNELPDFVITYNTRLLFLAFINCGDYHLEVEVYIVEMLMISEISRLSNFYNWQSVLSFLIFDAIVLH
ncbi:omega-amidase, chloroplastic-like [Camellia sinensis]|uniref:omega-amidase, chloroplastic-like n=1 Tax=Camellia sinensis TaxID=4442 RepID=UPI001036A53A|nr:omega-amidase, chloroplastic-like [Camellia sinensis]